MKKEHYIIFGLVLIIAVVSVVFYYETKGKGSAATAQIEQAKDSIIVTDTETKNTLSEQEILEEESRREGKANRENVLPLKFLKITTKAIEQSSINVNVKRVLGIVTNDAEFTPYCEVYIAIKFYDADNYLIVTEKEIIKALFSPKSDTEFEREVRQPTNAQTISLEVIHARPCTEKEVSTVTFD